MTQPIQIRDYVIRLPDPLYPYQGKTRIQVWAHRNFLTVVHQANEIIEREAGPKSETLAVYWGLTEAMPELALQVTVVDAGSPQTPFTFADVTDLEALRQEFCRGCGGQVSPGQESAMAFSESLAARIRGALATVGISSDHSPYR